MIVGLTVAAVYVSNTPEARGYTIFYLGTAIDGIAIWRARAFNDKTNTFLAGFQRIQVPSTVKK